MTRDSFVIGSYTNGDQGWYRNRDTRCCVRVDVRPEVSGSCTVPRFDTVIKVQTEDKIITDKRAGRPE